MSAGTQGAHDLPGVRAMWAAGIGAVGRYTGTLFAVFVANVAVTLVCWISIWMVLANALARIPMFDAAVDGDLVAMVHIVRSYKEVFVAVGSMVIGIVTLWSVISCFLYGGLIAMLAEAPDGRAATARSFGGGGAANFLRCVRLLVVSVMAQISILVMFSICVNAAAPAMDRALTGRALIGPVVLALGPPLLLTHVLWTIADYARIELVLHGDTHGGSAMAAYLRAMAFVLRRPRTLLHGAAGWLVIAVVTVSVWLLAHGSPMYGAGGAMILFAVRQGVALLRTAVKMAMIGGQVALGKARPEPGPVATRAATDR